MKRKDCPNQFDLFECSLKPKPADIVAFPAGRMVGAMRDIAAEVLALPIEKRKGKLDLEVWLLQNHLNQLRVPDVARHAEVFRAGITGQMRKRLILEILAAERDGTA